MKRKENLYALRFFEERGSKSSSAAENANTGETMKERVQR